MIPFRISAIASTSIFAVPHFQRRIHDSRHQHGHREGHEDHDSQLRISNGPQDLPRTEQV